MGMNHLPENGTRVRVNRYSFKGRIGTVVEQDEVRAGTHVWVKLDGGVPDFPMIFGKHELDHVVIEVTE